MTVPGGKTLRVVVADDQALVRVGFCGIIAATPGFAVVGEAGNGAEAGQAAPPAKPRVILMDVRVAGLGGIEATPRVPPRTGGGAPLLATLGPGEEVFPPPRG